MAKTTTVTVLSIDIVAASIVLNDNSQYLLFSLLFWFLVSSQSHCILREQLHRCYVLTLVPVLRECYSSANPFPVVDLSWSCPVAHIDRGSKPADHQRASPMSISFHYILALPVE